MQEIELKKIAEELNISQTTVSRALSGNGRVAIKTKERIQEYLQANGYVLKNKNAEFSDKKTKNICITLPGEDNFAEMPYFQATLLSVIDYYATRDYNVIPIKTSAVDISELEKIIKHHKVDGVILTRTIRNGIDIEFLKAHKVPFIVIGSYEDDNVYQVDVDQENGCKELTSLLLKMGYRRLALLCADMTHVVTQSRYNGFFKAHIENDIISNAGLMGSITVATNMAGRGTDIVLGPGVKELGGLYVIGTTRNKSKRIDKQLRGRSGRQGDPGVSKYFCCLEDDLVITHFRGKVLANIMKYLSDSTGRIKNKKIIKEINRALSIRESIDKASRKSLEELNENYNMQRDAIYSVRKDLLECSNEELIEHIKKFINKFVDILFEHYENNIVTDLSHLIDVRSLYSKNKKVYKSNIKEALFNKFNSVLNSVNLEEYLQKVREKALRSIDNNWHDFMEELEFDQPTSSIAQESMEKYNYRIAKKFHEELAPNILIEVITYAINQDLIPEEVIDKNEEMSL